MLREMRPSNIWSDLLFRLHKDGLGRSPLRRSMVFLQGPILHIRELRQLVVRLCCSSN